jgi:hypothetical protein
MAGVEDGLRWVSARVHEVIDQTIPDAIQLRRREGERSWPVHSFHRCEDPAATESAVRAELAQLVEEATETGRPLHVRIVVVRAGVPHASRTVYIPPPERPAEEDTHEAERGAGAVGAVVATNRDLRSLLEVYARQQGATVSTAMQGWAGSMARTSELEREVAELRAALVLAEQAQEQDPVIQQALTQLVPQLPMLIASFATSKQGQGEP